jgi:hypothetical protein
LIVVCCLLLSASTIAIVVTKATSASASAVNAASSASTAYAAAAALAFRLGGASRRRGQQTPWSSPGGWGERSKRSILVHILLNKEPTLVAGQSKTAFGGNRNPEESRGIWSKYRNSCPTGIPAKNSCDRGKKQEFLRPPPKPRSCEKFLRKTQEKKEILRNPVIFCF